MMWLFVTVISIGVLPTESLTIVIRYPVMLPAGEEPEGEPEIALLPAAPSLNVLRTTLILAPLPSFTVMILSERTG